MIRARFVREFGAWFPALHIAALAGYARIDAYDPGTGNLMRSASTSINLYYCDLARNAEPAQRESYKLTKCYVAMQVVAERLRLDGFEEINPCEADAEIPPLPETVLA